MREAHFSAVDHSIPNTFDKRKDIVEARVENEALKRSLVDMSL